MDHSLVKLNETISYAMWKWKKVKSLSRVWLFVTPWTVAHQAPPSMEFSRQEYWSGLPFPSPGDLPNPGIEPRSPELQAVALTSEPPGKPLCHVVPPKADKSSQRVLTKHGPLEKGMANHSSILALRTPWTAWTNELMETIKAKIRLGY